MNGLALADLRRALSRRRALLSAGLAAGAMAAALSALAPGAPALTTVVTAAHDLSPGAVLTVADLTSVDVPPANVADGAALDAAELVGRLVAAPVRRGETVTDVRLLGAGLLAGAGQGEVAVPVRVAEPVGAALVTAGDRIDLLLASPEGSVQVLAAGARVLSVPALGDDGAEGALLVIAAPRATATQLAAAAVTGRLTLSVLPR